jgi:hypothetical protein
MLHAADHAKHLANIAAAAFTAIAAVGTSIPPNWSGLPLTSRLAIGLGRSAGHGEDRGSTQIGLLVYHTLLRGRHL